VADRFENLRKTLRARRYAPHREKTLAFWTLPSDRRLPGIFLNRTLQELLVSSFSELAATPGVGQKKMLSLVDLLSRAVDTHPEDLVPATTFSRQDGDGQGDDAPSMTQGAALLNPDQISEVTWGKWCASVVALGLEKEPLGRFVSSLRELPSAGWNTPLGRYTCHTLAEIRNMRTHGRKCTRAIVEVFHRVHEIASRIETTDNLASEICLPRVRAVEHWIRETLGGAAVPSRGAIFEHFIRPLVEQLEVDGATQVVRLAHYRLGIDGPITSAGEAARRMRLTRARVYQLLNMINDILMLRWPLGRRPIHDLCDHLADLTRGKATAAELSQFFAAVELFYPRHRRLTLVAGQVRRDGKRGS